MDFQSLKRLATNDYTYCCTTRKWKNNNGGKLIDKFGHSIYVAD